MLCSHDRCRWLETRYGHFSLDMKKWSCHAGSCVKFTLKGHEFKTYSFKHVKFKNMFLPIILLQTIKEWTISLQVHAIFPGAFFWANDRSQFRHGIWARSANTIWYRFCRQTSNPPIANEQILHKKDPVNICRPKQENWIKPNKPRKYTYEWLESVMCDKWKEFLCCHFSGNVAWSMTVHDTLKFYQHWQSLDNWEKLTAKS